MKKIITMLMLAIFMVGATPIAEASNENVLKTSIQGKAISIDNVKIKALKNKYEITKNDVYHLKTKVRNCEQTGDCVKIKEDLRLKLKDHVLDNIKLLHKHLTKSKMRFEQKKFREEYRKEIDGWYNGFLHVALIYMIGFLSIYYYLMHISGLKIIELFIIEFPPSM